MQIEQVFMRCPKCGHNVASDNSLYKCSYCDSEFYIFPKNKIDKVQIIQTEEDIIRQKLKTDEEIITFNNHCKDQLVKELGTYLLEKGYLTMEKGKWNFLNNSSYRKYSCLVAKPD